MQAEVVKRRRCKQEFDRAGVGLHTVYLDGKRTHEGVRQLLPIEQLLHPMERGDVWAAGDSHERSLWCG